MSDEITVSTPEVPRSNDSGQSERNTSRVPSPGQISPATLQFYNRSSLPVPDIQEINAPQSPTSSSNNLSLGTLCQQMLVPWISLLLTRTEQKEDRIKILEQVIEIVMKNIDSNRGIFYCLATQLYRLGRPTNVCPLCLKQKKNRRLVNNPSTHPDCHIFSKCLLDEYKNIHCPIDDEEFIYNQFSGHFSSSRRLTFPIFCQTCDNAASKEENLLKKLYKKITAANKLRLSIPTETAKIIKHILAVIMFRGMLLGVNFLDEFSSVFTKKFELLRKYCCTYKFNEYEKHTEISDQFHVFILPNINCNVNNPHSTYILDLQLRNPSLTTVVRGTDDDTYWYMKFDTFQCILPLKCGNNILFDKSCFYDPNKDKYELPLGKEGFQIFPKILWVHNVRQLAVLVLQSNSLNKPCKFILQDPLIETLIETSLEYQLPVTETDSDDLPVQNIEDLPEVLSSASARSMSPLSMSASESEELKDLNVKFSDLKTANKKLLSKHSSLEKSFKTFKSTSATKEADFKTRKSDMEKTRAAEIKMWQQTKKELQKENEELRRKIEDLLEKIKLLQESNRRKDGQIQDLKQKLQESSHAIARYQPSREEYQQSHLETTEAHQSSLVTAGIPNLYAQMALHNELVASPNPPLARTTSSSLQ